jgi:alpha-L-fucosidase
MQRHSRSIYGCTQAPAGFTTPQDCRLTQNGDRLYVHVYAWPFRALRLPGLAGRVAYARLLHDGSEVQIKAPTWEAEQLQLGRDDLLLWLPVKKPEVVVPVIELTLNAG